MSVSTLGPLRENSCFLNFRSLLLCLAFASSYIVPGKYKCQLKLAPYRGTGFGGGGIKLFLAVTVLIALFGIESFRYFLILPFFLIWDKITFCRFHPFEFINHAHKQYAFCACKCGVVVCFSFYLVYKLPVLMLKALIFLACPAVFRIQEIGLPHMPPFQPLPLLYPHVNTQQYNKITIIILLLLFFVVFHNNYNNGNLI